MLGQLTDAVARVETKIELNDDYPTSESMPIEEATISNRWAMASIVEVLERKGLCTKQDLHAIIDGYAIRILVRTLK